MRTRTRVASFLFVASLLSCARAAVEPAPNSIEPGSRPEAAAAPDFTVTTFDGEEFSLREHRGRLVVLNFWESW